jgi:hypothetical protein
MAYLFDILFNVFLLIMLILLINKIASSKKISPI